MVLCKKSLFSILVYASAMLSAESYADNAQTIVKDEYINRAVLLPAIVIEAMDDGDPIKTYVDYKQANVTRNGLDRRDIPQSIDTIDVSKYKMYGANDLSIMLQGTPGVSTSYDAEGDGISIRGFNADVGDIYRDGIRDSGKIRRSTANVERIEILKGPASVLYGRNAGGGVINMVSKVANFNSRSSIGTYIGSYDNYGATLDINQILNGQVAVRLTSEYNDTNSFRRGIGQDQTMLSPSITFQNDDETLLWTTQYTYDSLDRVTDRGPYFYNLPEDVPIDLSFAQAGDYTKDELQLIRSDLNYQFLPNWNVHWAVSYRQANQDYDNFFGGSYCETDTTKRNCKAGYVLQNYKWQKAANETFTNTFDISGQFDTGIIRHQLLMGVDVNHEIRDIKFGSFSDTSTSGPKGYINPYDYSDRFVVGSRINTVTSHNYHEGNGLGFFVQDLLTLVPQVKLMLGLRYDTYEFKSTDKLIQIRLKNNDESLSPNVGIVWQPIEDHSLYASYNKSFAPYGGRGYIQVNSSESTESEYNQQYEIGMKSDWFNQQLSTQLALYRIEKNNIRYQPDATNQPDIWAIAGEHESKGVELSFIGQLLDNVFVRGGYGYTDAKVTKDTQTPTNMGNRLGLSSKNTGNLFLRYLPTENLYGEVGVTYVGSFYNNVRNERKVDGFNRIDAAIGYKNDQWGATLAINNITDEKYWRFASMPGTSRNYLFRVNYFF
ncbi:TonB-dependent receptor [Acinetobacter puyangensis]|uniref:TonB-dependent receptor n=1 Tax=Acinetobacter puyangensis TaxID=1096779 RepID=UPI003A4DDCC9